MTWSGADRIDNEPLRQACERLIAEGATWSELAIKCGHTKKDGLSGDTSWLRRKLGIKPHQNVPTLQKKIRYVDAETIVYALDLDPHDIGI